MRYVGYLQKYVGVPRWLGWMKDLGYANFLELRFYVVG